MPAFYVPLLIQSHIQERKLLASVDGRPGSVLQFAERAARHSGDCNLGRTGKHRTFRV